MENNMNKYSLIKNGLKDGVIGGLIGEYFGDIGSEIILGNQNFFEIVVSGGLSGYYGSAISGGITGALAIFIDPIASAILLVFIYESVVAYIEYQINDILITTNELIENLIVDSIIVVIITMVIYRGSYQLLIDNKLRKRGFYVEDNEKEEFESILSQVVIASYFFYKNFSKRNSQL